jgi:two-component system chemotaxis response regulator CheY
VDDDEDIREMLGQLLRLEGFEAETASDGLDALDRLRASAHPFALILLDLRMPRFNGIDFMLVARRDPALASIPILVMSGDTSARTAAQQAGAKGCLLKPVDVDELIAVVRRCAVPGSAAA